MFLLLSTLLFAPAQATEIGAGANLGLGVMLGHPTGITGKYYLGGRTNAVDLAVASAPWGWRQGGGVYAHGVYLWHPSVLVSESDFEIPWHVGIGPVFWSGYWGPFDGPHGGEGAVGVRVPVGLDLDLRTAPVQIFLDVALNFYVIPATFADVGGAIGARYYF